MNEFVTVKKAMPSTFVLETSPLVDERAVERIQTCLAGAVPYLCVYGDDAHTYKMCTVEKALEVIPYTIVTYEALDKRSRAREFLCEVENTHMHLVVGYEDVHYAPGYCEWIHWVKTKPRLSAGTLLFVLSSEDKRKFSLTQKNITWVEVRDPNRFRVKTRKCDTQPLKNILPEAVCFENDAYPMYGYYWGVVHENYPDACNTLDELVRIAECMSVTDMFDYQAYTGAHWDLLAYTHALGIRMPCHLLPTLTGVRKGSAWTRFNMVCTNQKRLAELSYRVFKRTTLLCVNTMYFFGHTLWMSIMEASHVQRVRDIIHFHNTMKAEDLVTLYVLCRFDTEKNQSERVTRAKLMERIRFFFL